ncbi:MAG: hypothetical protein V4556_07360, partial [Bacteroidota bacterium]
MKANFNSRLNKCLPKIRGWLDDPKISTKRTVLFFLALFTFSFSFAQVDFRQSANDDKKYGQGNVHWINSILQQNNSTYTEGMSSLQRTILLNIAPTPGNNHSLIFDFQTVKSSTKAHAYDFLTSWDQAVAASDAINGPGLFVNINDCGAEPASDPTGFLTECAAAHAGYSATVSYSDNMGDPPGYEGSDVNEKIAAYEARFGDRTIQIWSKTPITNVTLRQVGVACKERLGYQKGPDPDFRYELSWTSTSSTIVVEYGAHLAVGVDPLEAGIGYGEGKGAGSISGGPYHTHLRTLDCESLGSRDNQIKIERERPTVPPTCEITGPPCFDNTTTSLPFSAVINTDEGPITSYQWSFVSNSANAVLSGSSSGSLSESTGPTTINIDVVPGFGGFTMGGSFSLQLEVNRNGITHICTLNGNVTSNVVTATASPTLVNLLSASHSTQLGVTVSTGSVNDYNYQWSVEPAVGGTFNSTTISNPIFTVNDLGVYTFTVVATSKTDAQCSSQDTVMIATSAGFPPCSQDPQTMCSGVSTTFTVHGAVNPDPVNISYLWSIIPSTAGTINGSATGQDVSVTSSSTTNFTVRLTMLAASGLSINCNYPVTIVTAPTVTVNAPARCTNGDASTITATPAGAANYAWTVPAGVTNPGNVSSFSATVEGVYSVSITVEGNACPGAGSATLVVNDPPTVNVTAPARCSNGDASTISVTPAGAANYAWTVPTGVTNPGNVSSFSATAAGVYSVTVTLANGCSATNSATLVVNDPPTVNVTAPARCSNGDASTIS